MISATIIFVLPICICLIMIAAYIRYEKKFPFKWIAVLAFFSACAVSAMGQGVAYLSIAATTTSIQGQKVLKPFSPGYVFVYTDVTGTTLATIYSEITLTTAKPNPIPTDQYGNFGFWTLPSTVYFRICPTTTACTAPIYSSTTGGFANGSYANNFPGADIGAKINAAFEACGGTMAVPITSCIVKVSPGAYSFSTTIHIPNTVSHGYIYNPQLQLEGSSLSYTGTGDAFAVHGENANAPGSTGLVANGTIVAPAFVSGVNVFHFTSRLGFTLDRLNISGGENCILLENTTADGGPGYHEEDTFTNFQTQSCLKHVAGIRTSGTASFEYNHFDNWHLQMAGQNVTDECGICVVASTDWQGLYMVAKVNTSGAATIRTSVIQADGGGMFRGYLDIHGENTGGATLPFGLYAKNGGNIAMDGSVIITGFSNGTDGGQFAQAVVNTYAYHAVESPSAFGAPARRCAYLYDAQSPTHNMAQVGAEIDCTEQWRRRATSASDPSVQSPIAGGAPFFNVMNIFATGQIGIGPGWQSTPDGSGIGEIPNDYLAVRDKFGIYTAATTSTTILSRQEAINIPTSGRTCSLIGQGETANNAFLTCFNFTGAGSTSNSLTIFPYAGGNSLTMDALGNVKLLSLAGTGNRLVCTHADGTIYPGTTTTCP